MPDSIGNISVPEIPPVGTFPLTSDYPHGEVIEPQIFVHPFGSANAKIEQRYWRGNGARRFLFRRRAMSPADRASLISFWEARSGAYEPFTYNVHLDGHDQPATAVTCRFEDPTITLEEVTQHATGVGVVLVEEITTGPTYTLSSTLTRFPSATLKTALLGQTQTLIPLIHVKVNESGRPDNIFLSDRRVAIGSRLYLPRIARWGPITQSINGASDSAEFVFGNADRVMTDLAADTDLWRAAIEFSLFHVDQRIKVDLWSGLITDYRADTEAEFAVRAGDILSALSLSYPRRRIQRTCWKIFNDGKACPYAAEGRGGDPNSCDKGFSTPNGCVEHGMQNRFGGITGKPAKVFIKDNSQGFLGFGRPTITSASIVADSIYGQVVPEVYTDSNMPVNAKIALGRDESEYYAALGVVSEGPLGGYGRSRVEPPNTEEQPQYPPGFLGGIESSAPAPAPVALHKLDGQPHHGPGSLGLRESLGPDPNPESFSIGKVNENPPPASIFGPERAAGTAFVVLRRTDPVGLQLSQLSEHKMVAVVSRGMSGFQWTAPEARTAAVLTNPIWIALNAFLRALHLEFESAANQKDYFVVQKAIDAAAICDQSVIKRIGSGRATQYKFKGVLGVEKPLRDWLAEILNNCLGYFSFEFGKLKLGIRNDSSAREAFTAGNILWRTLRSQPLRPQFNHLSANFGDEEFEFAANSVNLYDEAQALEIGFKGNPTYLKRDLNLAGTSTKDQAARIVTTRLREELGGITAAERQAAREWAFKTTALALAVAPGMVISITHADAPGAGPAELRVRSWTLHQDFSIDIQGRSTTNSMYNLTVGEKPADVEADPVPEEVVPDLAPGDVTNLTASEDPLVEDDGAVRSEVTLSYEEPDPVGVFAGVKLYMAKLDSDAVDGTGSPIEEPHLVTSIPQNDTPAARRFSTDPIAVVAGSAGAVRLYAAGFSPAVETNPLTAPTVDVLLDGKQSPPNPPTNLSVTALPLGFRAGWTLPADRDYAASCVYLGTTAVLSDAELRATVSADYYVAAGLTAGEEVFVWVRAKDRSGNLGEAVGPEAVTPTVLADEAAAILTGDGSPDDTTNTQDSKNGDLYVQTDGTLWKKESGVWSKTGIDLSGKHGTSIHRVPSWPPATGGIANPLIGDVAIADDGQWGEWTGTAWQLRGDLTGPIGPIGPKGPTGDQGLRGGQGPEGDIGPQGNTGDQGLRGEQGPEGDIGPQGNTGDQGLRGGQGTEGDIGPKGNEGPQGAAGSPGADGDQVFVYYTNAPADTDSAQLAPLSKLTDGRWTTASGYYWHADATTVPDGDTQG